MKVHAFGFNMILLSSTWRVPRPSYPLRSNFGREGKVSFSEKAKIAYCCSRCSPRERTCSKLQYDAYLICLECSYTELSISENLGDKVKDRFSKKLKILMQVSKVWHGKEHGFV